MFSILTEFDFASECKQSTKSNILASLVLSVKNKIFSHTLEFEWPKFGSIYSQKIVHRRDKNQEIMLSLDSKMSNLQRSEVKGVENGRAKILKSMEI